VTNNNEEHLPFLPMFFFFPALPDFFNPFFFFHLAGGMLGFLDVLPSLGL